MYILLWNVNSEIRIALIIFFVIIKVTGNTIYNMLEMENVEVDQNDFPVYPPKIYKTEVTCDCIIQIILLEIDNRNR